ncbi:MAG: hypothetical protein R2747_05310 [Pyrinomonadaceae bacterium]
MVVFAFYDRDSAGDPAFPFSPAGGEFALPLAGFEENEPIRERGKSQT